MEGPIASAERVADAEGRQYHINLAPGEVAPAIILVGDPNRARRVAGLFDAVELERQNREYLTFTGTHQGMRVTVMGTGMGAGSTEIAVIELCQCVEAPVMIRCGSTGGLQPDMRLGDLAISQGALRLENATLHFVEEGYPAVADPMVVMALAQAADEAGLPAARPGDRRSAGGAGDPQPGDGGVDAADAGDAAGLPGGCCVRGLCDALRQPLHRPGDQGPGGARVREGGAAGAALGGRDGAAPGRAGDLAPGARAR